MKKFLSVLLTIALLLGVCGAIIPTYAAEDDPTFLLATVDTELDPGQSLTFTLKGKNLEGAEGIQLYIDYDPTLFELTDIGGRSMMPEGWDCSLVRSKTNGRLLYMAYRPIDAEGLDNSEVRMQTFSLRVKSDVPTCTSEVGIEVVKLCDDRASDMYYNEPEALSLSLINPDRPILAPKPGVVDGTEIYEAEEAEVDGGQIRDINNDQGGRLVGQLGSDGGRVTFTIETPCAGERKMDIYYNSAADRSFDIIINDRETSVVAECPGEGDWNSTIAMVTVTVNLDAGVNTVVFDSFNGPAPNLDRIEIESLREMTAAEETEILIDGIGAITSLAQKPSVDAARLAYDALSADEKQTIADKLPTLIAAEAAIQALVDESGLPGDVNLSGVVDVADIMKIKDLIMTENWDELQLQFGDLSANGALDVADIMQIKNIIMSN